MTDLVISKTEYQKLDDFYRRIRDQVEHENDLYNQRIIWLITIQGFLYATAGIVIQAIIPIEKIERVQHVNHFLLLICFLGIVVALIAYRLLSNARSCLQELRDLWDDRISGWSAYEEDGKYFPHVSGGTAPAGRLHWLLRSGNLPLVFAGSWILGAILLLRNVNLV